MFLTVNHNEANNGGGGNFQPIAEGTYEAIIKEAEVTKSSSGNDMIKLTLVIRDDVRQQFGKRKIWDYIVPDKVAWKVQQLSKALKFEQGKQFATIQEYAKEILFKSLKIKIKHEEETYNGETKTRERIALYDTSDIPSSSQQSDPFQAPPTQSNASPF
jgi:hypothetical protein